MKSCIMTAVSAVALGVVCTTVTAAETIKMAAFTWPGAVVTQSAVRNILETRLGYSVEMVSARIAAGMAAMCKGDGSIDVQVDFWMPNHKEKWDKYIAEGSRSCVEAGDHPYVGKQGLYVPGYVQDEYNIHNVSDLSNPEVAKLFDQNGDGKGEWWPGPAGWGSTNVLLVKAKSYGFDKYFEPIIVSEGAFKAKFRADQARKRPVLFFYWTPEALFAKYDLRKLKEPAFDGYAMESKKGEPDYNPDGCYDMLQPNEDSEWLSKSSVTCAFPDALIYVTYSSTLKDRAPDVVAFLNRFSLDSDLVSDWIMQVNIENRDPDKVTGNWIKNHPKVVDSWLGQN